MNLKLRRLVRTQTSEQYALDDLDQRGDDNLTVCVGKLDLHYTDEGTYGTLLLWQNHCKGIAPNELDAVVQDLVSGFVEPMGVSGEYVVERFVPTLESYRVYSNIEE